MAIGAHPDDCDILFGGSALLYSRQGHNVKFLSVTNGDTGHHAIGGIELARRRYEETQAVAALAGITYDVWDIHCGELMPSIENRRRLIREIREFAPDVIFIHRPNDYHPDHRYASQLVGDSVYLVTVPNQCALTPHMRKQPAVFYYSDDFQQPCPFKADVLVDIGSVIDDKMRLLNCHTSQFYEWLPYNRNCLDSVPTSAAKRLKWLSTDWKPDAEEAAKKHQEAAALLYGKRSVKYGEAFQKCEYGYKPAADELVRLFPFGSL